jgi:hypothetical protein
VVRIRARPYGPVAEGCIGYDELVFLQEFWHLRHTGRFVHLTNGRYMASHGYLEGAVSRLAFRELGVVDAKNAALSVPVSYYVAGHSRVMFRLGYRASGAVPLTREVLGQWVGYLFGLLPHVESTVSQHMLRRAILLRDLCTTMYMWETTARGKESGRLLVDDFVMRGLACRPA